MLRQLLPRDLGFEVQPRDEASLFRWFLASFLFGNRISQAVAAQTWRVLVVTHGLDTPRRLCACNHRELVRMLGEGVYRRYDESTAERLTLLCRTLIDEYDGRILGIVADGVPYLKVDEVTRGDFEAAGSAPLHWKSARSGRSDGVTRPSSAGSPAAAKAAATASLRPLFRSLICFRWCSRRRRPRR